MKNKVSGTKKYDVTVLGAGVAGFAAALQCSRAGMRTLLIEKSGIPGGTCTLAGMGFPGLFHAWGKQVIAGIGWEMVERCMKEENKELPDFSKYENLPHWKLQIPINNFLFACLLDEEFINSGVDVLYHAMPIDVKDTPKGVSVKVCGKNAIRSFDARFLIDCSGDANAVELADYKLVRHKEKQPATQMFTIDGYDLKKLDLKQIDIAYRKAVSNGSMKDTDTGMSNSMAAVLCAAGDNSVHVVTADASGSEGKSAAECDGRMVVLRIYRFLKQLRGLENLRISFLAPECGIRETTVIKGLKTITVDDYESGRIWDDSVAYSFYPIDLHLNTREGLMSRKLKKGVVPTVPLGAMIPKGSHSLLVAGRCVSSDRLANSALRVKASCMVMGQAAGAAACVAIRNSTGLKNVDISEVKTLLKKHGAIVP